MLRLMRRAVPYLLLGLLTVLVAAAVGVGLQDRPRATDGVHTSGAAEAAITSITASTFEHHSDDNHRAPLGRCRPSTYVAPCRSATVQIQIPEACGGAGTVIVEPGDEERGQYSLFNSGIPQGVWFELGCTSGCADH